MSEQLCFQCFKIKGDYEVCPWCGYTPEKTMNQAYQLSPGTVLNERYIIGTTLGIGGFGITYKAYDTVLSIVVAIKEFYPARLVNRGEGETKVGVFSGEKQEEYNHYLQKFQEEAQIMAKFSKEKDIVNIYDYIEANATAYIVMEYVDAVLLKEYLKQSGKLSAEEATGYMLALLEALTKIHYNGIVHKDISPDNIFITGTDSIKLADFGAARLQGTRSSEKTEAIVKVGYTPPEQYQPNSEQGAFMDVYAAGAVFYEMLTGEKPQDSMDRQIEDRLKSPGKCGVEIEQGLDKIVMKAMAVKPKLRFQTAQQFKNAITEKQKVELPEDELRKRKRIRKAAIIGTAGISAVLLVLLVLSQTVFSTRGKLNAGSIARDTVRIWLAVEDEETGIMLMEAIEAQVKEQYPQLSLDMEAILSDEYGERLQEAIEYDELPEIFCTDYLPREDDDETYCQELSALMNTMELSSYLFLEELSKEKLYELPTAVQVGLVYVNTNKLENVPICYYWEFLADKEELTLMYADEEDAYKMFQSSKSEVNAIVGDLSDMNAVKEVTVNQIPPTDFAIALVYGDENVVGCFKNCYGVSKSAKGNRKEAAMVVLATLLSENIQSTQYMNNEEGIPVNRAVYEEYEEYKMTTYLKFLQNSIDADLEIQDGNNMCEILKGK